MMAQRRTGRSWWLSAAVFVAVLAVTIAAVTVAYLRHRDVGPDDVDCTHAKCVALTFDDGPTPFTDRLLHVLTVDNAKATFFLVGNKVAADPASARRIAAAGMEIGNHTWEHANMSTVPTEDIPAQLSKGTDAIAAATGKAPVLLRSAGGLINDANTAATRSMLMTRIQPGSVVLLHDTYSSTVDLVEQFIPVLKANGYHLVTVSHLLGTREPGSSYGSRVNGPPVNALTDVPAAQIPALPATPSPKPAPNLPITDIPNQNPGGPQ